MTENIFEMIFDAGDKEQILIVSESKIKNNEFLYSHLLLKKKLVENKK